VSVAVGSRTQAEQGFLLDADVLARVWTAVAAASGRDDDFPATCRTVLIEFFPTGVRLVATDSYVLLTGWIPAGLADDAPSLDEAPLETAVAIDSHGRALGLMKHLRKIVKEAQDSGVEPEVRLRVGQPPVGSQDTLALDGIDQRALIIDLPGHEELALRLFEGEFPKWRHLMVDHTAVATDVIALNPEIVGRLARLGSLYDNPLMWSFGGTNGPARVEIGPIVGIAMPMRWPGLVRPSEDADDAGTTT
jgi:hypothetical protein